MALLNTPQADFGSPLPEFSLPSVEGRSYSSEDFSSATALVVVFTCNHCPYAQAVRERIMHLASDFEDVGVQFVAINSNDADSYPEDSLENMADEEYNYNFPYLYDETQAVAKEFGAICTPDIFVYNSEHELVYRGRVDDNWQEPENVKSEDLRDALKAIVDGEQPSVDQHPSMGCSIKWRE